MMEGKESAKQPVVPVTFNMDNKEDAEALAALLSPALKGTLQGIHVETNAIRTNDFTIAALGNKEIRELLEQKYPQKLKKIIDNAVERTAISNQALLAQIESERSDTRMLRCGQLAGICFNTAAIIAGICMLHLGKTDAGIILVGLGVSTPIMNKIATLILERRIKEDSDN